MTSFTRNSDFFIDHSGEKPLIHCVGNFNRMLALNPTAGLLFAKLVETEAEGLGRVADFTVPGYRRVPCENGMASIMNRNRLWAEADKAQVVGAVPHVPRETPPTTKMTVAEFKAAFHKPGTTFHCPEHLKHELEE